MPTSTVIGAGPAGCTAAILLARAGWSVTLIEQHPFPRHKVCGECLSHLGFQVLTRLNLADEFLSANPTPLTQTLLHAPDGSSASIPLPHPMFGLSRHRLDPLLLTQAQQAGATLLTPYRCESLSPTTIRNLQNNEI
ncbi:MAG TPA: FAD-dependent oxidoreductase, partial [Tepidisphaeraceae bacterium]|nr:FAD-dependent oxidoreductase [Tepidisphaeraceae bacterium]